MGEGWIYEPKWDGFRCIIFKTEKGVYLQSRTGKDLTSRFPEIVSAILRFDKRSFVLDGEIAIPTSSGFSFDALVTRLRVAPKRLVQDVSASPAIFIAYDMLGDAGKELNGSIVQSETCDS